MTIKVCQTAAFPMTRLREIRRQGASCLLRCRMVRCTNMKLPQPRCLSISARQAAIRPQLLRAFRLAPAHLELQPLDIEPLALPQCLRLGAQARAGYRILRLTGRVRHDLRFELRTLDAPYPAALQVRKRIQRTYVIELFEIHIHG